MGEIDTLSSGAGANRFVLADTNWIGYNDGNSTTNGSSDFAQITHLNTSEDVIQLQGGSSLYRLQINSSDTELYLNQQ